MTTTISRKPSVADVADQAGVAPSTVSLVVNNRKGVSSRTREKVRRVIDELNYVPLPGGRPRRSIVAGRTLRIGLVAAGIPRAHLNAPVYMDVLHGVETAVAERGDVMVLRHLPDLEHGTAALLPQELDGVVLFTHAPTDSLVRLLRQTPCVRTMGVTVPATPWDHVSYDNQAVGRLAATHLLEHGHRHAAVIAPGDNPIFASRYAAFGEAMRAGGGTRLELVDPELAAVVGNVEQVSAEHMAALVDRVLAAEPRPTAVFAVADNLVQSLYLDLYRRGLQPGRDLAVIGCNNELPLLANLHPRPVTIDIHAESVGRKAVEQLRWRLEYPGEPRVTAALAPELVASSEWRREQSEE